MGYYMREFIKKHGEPFVETSKNGLKSRIYEWEENNVKYRIVTSVAEGNIQLLSPSTTDEIITYYSNRNSNKFGKFKNNVLNV